MGDSMDYIETKDRCIHEIDVARMKCKKCGMNYKEAKNNPRPKK